MHVRVLSFVAVVILCSVPLSAQDYPRGEVFGGVSAVMSEGSDGMYGWQASTAVNLSRKFSLVGDVGGAYKGLSNGYTSRLHSVLGGPRATFRRDKRVSPFLHVLAGVTTVSCACGSNVSGFQLATGFGLDVRAGSHLKIRAIQYDILTSRLGGNWGGDVRIGSGLVFPF